MSAIRLVRIDPAVNMRRFYRLDLQPNLFGEWAVVTEWGRIGSGGQVRNTPYPSREAAEIAIGRQRAVKERRGYKP